MSFGLVTDGPAPMAWDEYAAIVRTEWQELLNRDDTGEADFHGFLERHPCMIPGQDAFTGAGGWSNPASSINGCVVSEPLLPGISDRFPDFMWAPTDSQTQWIVLIEIEDPKKPWFVKSGQKSEKLTQAEDQIAQWHAHLKKPSNLLSFIELYDIPRFRPIQFVYCLVYGRRSQVAGRAQMERRNALRPGLGDVKWMTYDRLRPNEDARNLPCAKVSTDEVLTAVAFPPTAKIDSWHINRWSALNDKRTAIHASPHFQADRQRFLADRLDYWDAQIAAGLQIPVGAHFEGE